MAHAPKPIGELNGFWSLMFRVSLAVFPIFAGAVLTFSVWITREIFRHEKEIQLHEKELAAQAARSAEMRVDIRESEHRINALERNKRTP